jgi:hypothetical protein
MNGSSAMPRRDTLGNERKTRRRSSRNDDMRTRLTDSAPQHSRKRREFALRPPGTPLAAPIFLPRVNEPHLMFARFERIGNLSEKNTGRRRIRREVLIQKQNPHAFR